MSMRANENNTGARRREFAGSPPDRILDTLLNGLEQIYQSEKTEKKNSASREVTERLKDGIQKLQAFRKLLNTAANLEDITPVIIAGSFAEIRTISSINKKTIHHLFSGRGLSEESREKLLQMLDQVVSIVFDTKLKEDPDSIVDFFSPELPTHIAARTDTILSIARMIPGVKSPASYSFTRLHEPPEEKSATPGSPWHYKLSWQKKGRLENIDITPAGLLEITKKQLLKMLWEILRQQEMQEISRSSIGHENLCATLSTHVVQSMIDDGRKKILHALKTEQLLDTHLLEIPENASPDIKLQLELKKLLQLEKCEIALLNADISHSMAQVINPYLETQVPGLTAKIKTDCATAEKNLIGEFTSITAATDKINFILQQLIIENNTITASAKNDLMAFHAEQLQKNIKQIEALQDNLIKMLANLNEAREEKQGRGNEDFEPNGLASRNPETGSALEKCLALTIQCLASCKASEAFIDSKRKQEMTIASCEKNIILLKDKINLLDKEIQQLEIFTDREGTITLASLNFRNTQLEASISDHKTEIKNIADAIVLLKQCEESGNIPFGNSFYQLDAIMEKYLKDNPALMEKIERYKAGQASFLLYGKFSHAQFLEFSKDLTDHLIAKKTRLITENNHFYGEKKNINSLLDSHQKSGTFSKDENLMDSLNTRKAHYSDLLQKEMRIKILLERFNQIELSENDTAHRMEEKNVQDPHTHAALTELLKEVEKTEAEHHDPGLKSLQEKILISLKKEQEIIDNIASTRNQSETAKQLSLAINQIFLHAEQAIAISKPDITKNKNNALEIIIAQFNHAIQLWQDDNIHKKNTGKTPDYAALLRIFEDFESRIKNIATQPATKSGPRLFSASKNSTITADMAKTIGNITREKAEICEQIDLIHSFSQSQSHRPLRG